jgi:uncharacterized protein YecE (DUF72 family)
MFQFEYLNKQKMASQHDFEERFAWFAQQLSPSCQCAVEIRNANYLNEAYFHFLNQNRLSPVFLQGYWMPPVARVYRNWRATIRQQPTVVIRLHGPDRKGIEEQTGKRWDRTVAPRNKELTEVADMVKDLLDGGSDVYLNVNNHYEGSAPLTIQRIEQLIQ